MYIYNNMGYSVAALVILSFALPGPGEEPKPKTDNAANPDTQPQYYLVWRGDSVLRRAERGDGWKEGASRLGWFDPDGNFVPDARLRHYRAGQTPHSSLSSYTMPGFSGPIRWRMASAAGANHPTYEHRSGRLIAGVATPIGFIPDIGSKVLDLKGYDYKKADRVIWNMIDEEAAKYWTELRREKFPDERVAPPPTPPGPAPSSAGIPEGFEFRLYRTFMKSEPWFARVIGEVMELGYLNDEGEFIPDYGLPVFPFIRLTNPEVLNEDGRQRTIYYTLPKDGKDTEEAYEYRSGRLIKGTLQKTGNFVPEIGSTVIDFKDYDPLGRRRIYNLPGVLRRIEKK